MGEQEEDALAGEAQQEEGRAKKGAGMELAAHNVRIALSDKEDDSEDDNEEEGEEEDLPLDRCPPPPASLLPPPSSRRASRALLQHRPG